MSNLLEHLETLTDSRHAKGKQHSQTATLTIVLRVIKRHEIQKVQQLLAAFTATFTLDALHTQKND
jgi:hypothetical protein